jgi:hypothetical protein
MAISRPRGFDGYKGHAAVDPDCEIVTGAVLGPAAGGDAAMTDQLLADLRTDAGAVEQPVVYGDAAYGSGDNLEQLGATPMVKVQPPVAPGRPVHPRRCRC